MGRTPIKVFAVWKYGGSIAPFRGTKCFSSEGVGKVRSVPVRSETMRAPGDVFAFFEGVGARGPRSRKAGRRVCVGGRYEISRSMKLRGIGRSARHTTACASAGGF